MTDIPTSEVIADDGKSTPSLSPVDEKYVSEEKAEYSKGSQEVDEHGQPLELHRALSPAQLSMIAIGGSIGTGLVISSGTALAQGGPASLLIGYLIMGWCCWVVLTALGEMSTFMPSKNGFAGHATRFVDPAFGFTTGWTYLFKYLIITPNQLNASALLIQYWRSDLSPAIFVTIFFIFILFSNLCGVKFFGQFEYGMSFFKIVILTAIILAGFIVSLGGNPQHDRIGFRYWKNGGAFKEYKTDGATGRFLGQWSVLTLALFAYLGSELVGVCVGEARNPRKAFPSAVRKVIWRILWFYICGVIVIGMLVSPNNPSLTALSGSRKSTAAASPFVIAFTNVGIQKLPSIINASLLVFTLSAANMIYMLQTRILYGLAAEGKAPRIFLRCNRLGVPYFSLTVASLFCALAYLNVSAGGATTFGYLTATVTIFGGLIWVSILLSHIRFMAGLKAQGISRDTLPYKAPLQPWSSPIALFIVILVLIFKGFAAFMPTFQYQSFITNYIGFPVYFLLFISWKLIKKTKFISASEIDFSGAKAFDGLDEEEDDDEKGFSVSSVWKKTVKKIRRKDL